MFRYKNSKINIKPVSPQFPTGKRDSYMYVHVVGDSYVFEGPMEDWI